MILTCPACSTRFAVDTGAFGPGGRRVRCGSCRHVWHQPAPETEDAEPLPALFAEDRDDGATAAPRVAAGEEPIRRPIPVSRTRPPKKGGAGLAWAMLALVVIVVLGGAVVGREAVLAAWPEADRLYTAVGMPGLATGAGLELRGVSWKREKQGDVSVLLIEGEVANVSKQVRPVPRIRGAIVGNGGREISHWTFAPPEPKLLPGETVKFRTEIKNPPAGGESLTMNFSRES